MSGEYVKCGPQCILIGDHHVNFFTALDRDRVFGLLCAAARSGSPVGWPEGADAEGAELLRPSEFAGGEVWTGAHYVDADQYDWGKVPNGARLVARRKPEPVTRDVLAWDLEPGMTLANGIEVASVERLLSDRVKVSFASSEPATCLRTSPWAVLVEEPNG